MSTDKSKTPKGTQPKAQDGGDDDRTELISNPAAPDPDDDPTPLAPAASGEPEQDTTISPVAPVSAPVSERSDASDSGSTYRPPTDGTAPPMNARTQSDQALIAGAAGAGAVQAATMTDSISTDPTHAPPAPGPLWTLEPGAVINNMYRVEERIAHGGMGRVFRGVEIGTGEPVAIKVILPEMAEDPHVAQMFQREARTLRQLHHDAIVRYFAYVPPDANFNLHALVMGFIEGTKLSDKIKTDGPLDEKQVCQLFLRLAGGLDRAHKIGVVHRDLSPDNVMLPDNDITKALLIDFGISRSSTVKDVTIGNQFAGKLKYVSPEQLGAFGGEAEAPGDVYSFGLLMIVALTGQALAMGDSVVEAVKKRQSVPDLSEVPSNFQTLLYQMLQPDPTTRMQSMEDVIAGLRAIDGGDAVTMSATTLSQNNRAVPGLQAAPRANPIGDGFVTTAPTALPTAALPQGGGGFGKMLGLIALVAVIGGGVWYGMGMPGVQADATPDVAAASQGGLTRVAGTRETMLAETLTEPCSFATLRMQGQNAGFIEGFAADPSKLSGIRASFEAVFGMQPNVVTRVVQAPQCAALDFARTLQGTASGAIEMTLDVTTVARSEGVVGAIHDENAGRQNWLALVSPNGRVFSLMKQLAEPIGGQRRFSFRLPSAQPGTYVLIATASRDALVRAGAMVDGTAASDVLPLMVRELSEDGQGAVTIGVVDITR